MIEPDTPTTIWIKHSTYPAFLLASDEGKPLKPSSVILRHRHLYQQQRIVRGGTTSSEGPNGVVRHAIVEIPETAVQHGGCTDSSPTRPGSPPLAPHLQDASLSVTDDVSEAGSSAAGIGKAPASTETQNGTPSPPSRATTVEAMLFTSGRSSTVETSIGPLLVTRQERALHARGNKPHLRHEKTAWYFSSSNQFLDVPPTLPDISYGELYVHVGPEKQKQVWMWSNNSSWLSLQVVAPHPYLSDYILNLCSNGEPSWVTKETLRTYIGRIQKREAGRQTSQSRQSPTGHSTE